MSDHDHDDLYDPAPEGLVWVCGACGKTSPTQSGYDRSGKRVSGNSWDESCFMNSLLCRPATEREQIERGCKWVAQPAAPPATSEPGGGS